MARNGSGTYSNPYPNFVSGTVISSSEVDANNSDIATALTQSIAVDGQAVVTANIPLATHKLTGVSAGSAATDSLSLGQAQAEAFIWCGTAGGSADAITLAPSPAITAYAAGQRFVWMASGSVNTGATTVAISGLTAIALQDNGAALVAGNHAASKMFMGILNTTSTVQIMQVQISGTDPLIISSLTVSGTSLLTGVTTHGDDVVSDADSTDDLGTTSVRWANLFVDGITATDQITATGFTGTLDGILGSGAAAAASITTLTLTNDLTVANGGTGASTFAADGVLYGDGTSAVAATAVGTDGHVLTSNGSGSAPAFAAVVGGIVSTQVFTGSGTWTRPSGIRTVLVKVIGGGGGGGGVSNTSGVFASGGGGSGGYAYELIDVSSTSSAVVTIGAGGAGGAAGDNAGATGATSSFAALVTATGGGGGRTGGTTAGVPGLGGAGGTGAGGDYNGSGFPGHTAEISASHPRGGTGGGEGGAMTAESYTSAGNNAVANTGGGGSGGQDTGTTARAGGNGGSGHLIVWEYS